MEEGFIMIQEYSVCQMVRRNTFADSRPNVYKLQFLLVRVLQTPITIHAVHEGIQFNLLQI